MQYKCLQHPLEAEEFKKIISASGAKSYLEIGSQYGGSLWEFGNVLPTGSRIVSVDVNDHTSRFQEVAKSLECCVGQLSHMGYDAHLIWGDSANQDVVNRVNELGPFDVILIDGGHSYECVKADWENYAPLGKIIAIHDIAWKNEPVERGYRIEVPKFWNEIKGDYRHEEIMLDPTGRDCGLGIIWRD